MLGHTKHILSQANALCHTFDRSTKNKQNHGKKQRSQAVQQRAQLALHGPGILLADPPFPPPPSTTRPHIWAELRSSLWNDLCPPTRSPSNGFALRVSDSSSRWCPPHEIAPPLTRGPTFYVEIRCSEPTVFRDSSFWRSAVIFFDGDPPVRTTESFFSGDGC